MTFYCLKHRFISWITISQDRGKFQPQQGEGRAVLWLNHLFGRNTREVQMPDQSLMTTDGARLFVRTIDGSKGDLPPLLALHGAAGVQTHEDSQAAFGFLAHERRVIVFDARGNGASEGRPPLTHERWVRDVEELRAGLGVESLVLAGHSYGGFIALQYALEYPQRVVALILQNTAACGIDLLNACRRAVAFSTQPV